MLPEGMVSITMDDVVSITNFSPIGNEVSALETYPPHVKNIYQWPGPTAYSRFIKQEKRSTEEMNPQEEISFYLYWVCKFLVCNQVQKSFIPVAETLNGTLNCHKIDKCANDEFSSLQSNHVAKEPPFDQNQTHVCSCSGCQCNSLL